MKTIYKKQCVNFFMCKKWINSNKTQCEICVKKRRTYYNMEYHKVKTK